MATRTALSTLVATIAFCAGACSPFLTGFPEPSGSGDDCVGAYYAPTVDTVLAVGAMAAGAALATSYSDDGEGSFKDGTTAMMLSAFAVGLYGLVSGSYGYAAVGACRQQRAVSASNAMAPASK